MIEITSSGDFKNTMNWLQRMINGNQYKELERYGQMGVNALMQNTPVDQGDTKAGWRYEIIGGKEPAIRWYNTHVTTSGMPVAILIQYGHGTGTGGYVEGRDFINPAIKPIFDQIAGAVWKEVIR